MQLRQINLTLDPHAYSSLLKRGQNSVAVQHLSRIIPIVHEVDAGYPVIPRSIEMTSVEREKAQSLIDRLVSQIFRLNGATRILLQEQAGKLNSELAKFRDLGQDQRLKELLQEVRTREQDSGNPANKIVNSKEPTKEDLEVIENLGSALKDETPEQKKAREKAFQHMAEKRRAFIQAAKITPNIPAFGIGGLIMSGPRVYVPYFTANNFGLRSGHNKSARLGTLSLFAAEILATLMYYRSQREIITTSAAEDFSYYDEGECIDNLGAIIRALSHNDSKAVVEDYDVSEKAREVEQSAFEVWQIIKDSVNPS